MSDAAPEPFDPSRPVCIVSPHLDDAVFSCGQYLAEHPGATIVTVFAGAPAMRDLRSWNARTTREDDAQRAVSARRAEDAAAMRVLNARPCWLDLWDAEYLALPFDSVRAARILKLLPRQGRFLSARLLGALRACLDAGQRPVVASLREALHVVGASSVVAPLGLHHPDHRAVSNACLRLAPDSRQDWYLYLDVPYGSAFPKERHRRLETVGRRVSLDELAPVVPHPDAKGPAIDAYRSQLPALGAGMSELRTSLYGPERYWRVRSS